MNARTVLIILLFIVSGVGAIAQQPPLTAWYPLNGTADDSTGNYGPMDLLNTPFQPGGGILCNGIYRNSGLSGACNAETPIMPLSIFQSFTVKAEFMVDSLPNKIMPVLVGGDNWRWLEITLAPTGLLELRYNNSSAVATSTRICDVNTWYEIAMTYDSATATAQLSLDGVLASTASFTILHGQANDRTFSITDYGSGTTFRGIFKNLRIYATADISTGIDRPPHPVVLDESPMRNYPDPFTSRTTIEFQTRDAGHVSVRIIDLLGHDTGFRYDEQLPSGTHSVNWDADHLPSGLYIARISVGAASATKLMTVRR